MPLQIMIGGIVFLPQVYRTARNLAYVPAYAIPEWADERQRSVMEPPYNTRLNRPVLDQ